MRTVQDSALSFANQRRHVEVIVSAVSYNPRRFPHRCNNFDGCAISPRPQGSINFEESYAPLCAEWWRAAAAVVVVGGPDYLLRMRQLFRARQPFPGNPPAKSPGRRIFETPGDPARKSPRHRRAAGFQFIARTGGRRYSGARFR